MRFSLLPIVVLLMPILEIAGFIVVGKALGVWLTLALILLTSFLGLVILRSGGLGMIRDLQNASRTGGEPAKAIVSGGMRVIAGILLFLPGFITDTIGLLLLIPSFRSLIWTSFGPRIVVASSFKSRGFRAGPQGEPSSKVIDLDEDDFHRDGPRQSPWSSNKGDRDLPKS
ncbi:FxsA family protein [Agrobacterium rubi]|uniref:FxsA family protein n=1 Tax=Agrobacterium rubi TaxID=28099 RepID=UPI0015741AA1|nr:FxsA family protein [Agrobacterium rubi]NTE87551.1 membrane protein FxsA [Agrobacterium rubi]NTF03405.1 membrane protein FxsA [Agrobacterium rubi]